MGTRSARVRLLGPFNSAFVGLQCGFGAVLGRAQPPALSHGESLPERLTAFTAFHNNRHAQVFFALQFLQHVDDLEALADFIFADELRHLASEEGRGGGTLRSIPRRVRLACGTTGLVTLLTPLDLGHLNREYFAAFQVPQRIVHYNIIYGLQGANDRLSELKFRWSGVEPPNLREWLIIRFKLKGGIRNEIGWRSEP